MAETLADRMKIVQGHRMRAAANEKQSALVRKDNERLNGELKAREEANAARDARLRALALEMLQALGAAVGASVAEMERRAAARVTDPPGFVDDA